MKGVILKACLGGGVHFWVLICPQPHNVKFHLEVSQGKIESCFIEQLSAGSLLPRARITLERCFVYTACCCFLRHKLPPRCQGSQRLLHGVKRRMHFWVGSGGGITAIFNFVFLFYVLFSLAEFVVVVAMFKTWCKHMFRFSFLGGTLV